MDDLMVIIHNALQRAQNKGIVEEFTRTTETSNLFEVKLVGDDQVYTIGEVHSL